MHAYIKALTCERFFYDIFFFNAKRTYFVPELIEKWYFNQDFYQFKAILIIFCSTNTKL